MSRKIGWSREALDDAIAAFRYIARDSMQNAQLVADRIEAAANRLADMPIGRPGRVAGTYEVLARKTSYFIAYEFDANDDVFILRIIHAARDWRADSWPDD